MTELAPLLFWPALAGYTQAAVAYAGDALRPGRLGGYAIWGVRLGWLAQTALLGAQAARADGFPWTTWAGSLNLFVWMCVGAYLFWGCRARFRLLGLVVMPLAAVLFVVAWAAGGGAAGAELAGVVVALHVGLVLAAFAGFTLAAALAALYLWQERRLKRRAADVLRVRAPSLASLDAFAARTVAVALVTLTLGMAVAFAALGPRTGAFDATIAVALAAWCVYAALLVLRRAAGWHGRRTAYLALSGFALVLVVHLALTPLSHL